MPRAVRRVLVWVFLIQVLWSGVTAVIMAVLWRDSIDEPDISYACDDGGTCYSGPTTYLILLLVFGGICLGFLVITGLLVSRWRARAALRARLVATGVRVPALLARIDATGTTVNGRNMVKLVFEARPGGRVVHAVERSMVVLPLGTRATIAYDPADLTKAALVDDLDALENAATRRAEQAQQAFVDSMFQQRPSPSGLSAVRDAVAQNIEAALAELRSKLDNGAITQSEYDQQRDLLMRVLEMPTDRPLS
jgi:hypothetical protein